jgi:hypothetical protein
LETPATCLKTEASDDGKIWDMQSAWSYRSNGRIGWRPRSCAPSLAAIVTSFPISFSRRCRRSRDDTEIGRSWCTAQWGWWPRIGIFRHGNAGSTVSGPCSYRGSLREKGSINAEAFSAERAAEGGSLAWRACTAGCRAFRFCEGGARNLHEPFDSLASAIFLQSSCSQQQAENFLTIPNHFHIRSR